MRKYLSLLLPLLLCSCMHVVDSSGQKHLRSALQVTYAHVPGWDFCAGKWRHVTPDGQSQCDCFGEEGEVLPACMACYGTDKNLKPDCVAGLYEPLTKAQYCEQYPETEWCHE